MDDSQLCPSTLAVMKDGTGREGMAEKESPLMKGYEEGGGVRGEGGRRSGTKE